MNKITLFKAFFNIEKYMNSLRPYLVEKAIKRCPNLSYITNKSLTEMFTYSNGMFIFWYNDKDNSTRVEFYKSIIWYGLQIKRYLNVIFKYINFIKYKK